MATIIKSGTLDERSTGVPVRMAALQLENLADRAEDFLKSVQDRAAQIAQQAHLAAEQIRKRAEETGREAAMQAAEQALDEKVARQMATLLPALKKVIRDVEDAKQDWLKYWEQAAVELASAIAARIIRREVAQDPQIQLTWIREALELAAGASEIRLYLHPSDHDALAGNVALLAEEFAQLAPAQILASESVSAGGCLLTTQFGEIDQQIESQLARIEEELVDPATKDILQE